MSRPYALPAGPTRLAESNTSMPPPEPRSRTISPGRNSASAVGFPQPSEAATASAGSAAVSEASYRLRVMGSQPLSSAPPPQQAVFPAATCLAAAPYFSFTASCILLMTSPFNPLSRNLHNRFRGDGAIARTAFLVQKSQNLAKRIRVRRIPEERACAPHRNQAHLAQFFQMVRERGSGDAQFLLDFAGDHPGGMGGEKQTHDLQAWLGAESGKAVGATCDEEGVGLAHTSIIAEIR